MNKTTRPLQINEIRQIMDCVVGGFEYEENGKLKKFRPNKQLEIVILIQMNVGLRINDIIEGLFVKSFKNGKVEIIEEKTNKLQYRDVNPMLINLIQDYALENNLKKDDKLIKISARAIQKQLKIVCDYLGLENVGTHSFRKFYATTQYEKTKDIEIVKELLNHSSVATTQKYIKIKRELVDKASKEYFINPYEQEEH